MSNLYVLHGEEKEYPQVYLYPINQVLEGDEFESISDRVLLGGDGFLYSQSKDKYVRNNQIFKPMLGSDDLSPVNPERVNLYSLKDVADAYSNVIPELSVSLNGLESNVLAGDEYLLGDDGLFYKLINGKVIPIAELAVDDAREGTPVALSGDVLGGIFGKGFKMPKMSIKMPKFKMPKMKLPKLKFKMPKMKFKMPKINTSGITKGISNAGKSFSKGISSMGKGISGAGKSLSKAASGAVKSYTDTVKGAAKSYADFQKNNLKQLGKAGEGLVKGIGDVASGLMDSGMIPGMPGGQDAEPEEEEQPQEEESQEEQYQEESPEEIEQVAEEPQEEYQEEELGFDISGLLSSGMGMLNSGGGIQGMASKLSTKSGRTQTANSAIGTGLNMIIPGAGSIFQTGIGAYNAGREKKALAKKAQNDKNKKTILSLLQKKQQSPKPVKKIVRKPTVIKKAIPKSAIAPIQAPIQSFQASTPIYSNISEPTNFPPEPPPHPLAQTNEPKKDNTLIIVGGGVVALIAIASLSKKK